MIPHVLALFHKNATLLLQRYGLVGACLHVAEVARIQWPKWQAQRAFAEQQAAFDRRRGVRTAVRIRPDDLAVIGPHRAAAVPYQPIAEEEFQKMFVALLPLIGPSIPQYSFVDLGCGMGKALLLAAAQPFRQIIGVEFAPHLAAICDNNIRADRLAHARRCQTISVVVGDAARFSFPDGPLVVFMYNPFGPEVLAPVLNNFRRRVESQPHQAFVAYLNARHAHLFKAAGFTQVWGEGEDRIFTLGSNR